MSKNKLFQELNLSHNPHRNGYDLGFPLYFSAKIGELLPVMHRTVMPGEKFKMSVSDFTRTAPLNAPGMTKVRSYYDFFFVPYRLLWSNAPTVHTENTRNPVTADSYASNTPVGNNTPRFDSWKYRDVNSDYGYLWKLMQYENEFGFNRGLLSAKLLNHLGYGYLSTETLVNYETSTHTSDPLVTEQYLSLYPLLAYQKIYYDFYRNTQWEDNQPYNYNVDYLGIDALWDVDVNENPNNFWDNPTLFDLRYANYPKDLFFGLLPDAQYGDTAVISVGTQSGSDAGSGYPDGWQQLQVLKNDGTLASVYPSSLVGNATVDGETSVHVWPSETSFDDMKDAGTSPIASGFLVNAGVQNRDWFNSSGFGIVMNELSNSFNVLQLRKAQFLQKYKEILGSGNSDYQAVVQKIFGVDVSDAYSYHSIYLGGHSQDINVTEVENTNLVDSSATLKGKGVGSGHSDLIDFEAPDFGIIMCIYHCAPIIEYSLNALHFDVTKTEQDDYANPVFDQLGFQEFSMKYMNVERPGGGTLNDEANSNEILGYTTRYFDYKTSVGNVLGFFRDTVDGSAYLSPVNFDYLTNYYTLNNSGQYVWQGLTSSFFHVNPSLMDGYFVVDSDAYVTTDQFYISANFEVNAVRPLDYYGMPY